MRSDEVTVRNTGNEEFVTILYRALLNREPGAGGYAIWLNRVNRGDSRGFEGSNPRIA